MQEVAELRLSISLIKKHFARHVVLDLLALIIALLYASVPSLSKTMVVLCDGPRTHVLKVP